VSIATVGVYLKETKYEELSIYLDGVAERGAFPDDWWFDSINNHAIQISLAEGNDIENEMGYKDYHKLLLAFNKLPSLCLYIQVRQVTDLQFIRLFVATLLENYEGLSIDDYSFDGQTSYLWTLQDIHNGVQGVDFLSHMYTFFTES